MRLDGPLTVLLPHPDDEFAVFPWLRQALGVGHRVRCIWLTDGGRGGQDVWRRRAESIEVLSGLGMGGVEMHFPGTTHSIPDGGLHARLEDVAELLDAMSFERGEILLVPAWEGGHPDHDAAHLIGRCLVARHGIATWQFPLYNGVGLPGSFFRVMHPLTSNGECHPADDVSLLQRLGFVRACTGYRSQWRSFVGLLPLYLLKMFGPTPFVLQPVTSNADLRKPHSGRLLYERRGPLSWEEFERSAMRQLDRR